LGQGLTGSAVPADDVPCCGLPAPGARRNVDRWWCGRVGTAQARPTTPEPSTGGVRRISQARGGAWAAESTASDLDRFPAIRVQGDCRDLDQGRVQLRQLSAPCRPGIGLREGLGFLWEPLSLAVMIWAVHSSPAVARQLLHCQSTEAHRGSRKSAGMGSSCGRSAVRSLQALVGGPTTYRVVAVLVAIRPRTYLFTEVQAVLLTCEAYPGARIETHGLRRVQGDLMIRRS
jgi:hypothetical protein